MGKVTLEFDSIEESFEVDCAINGHKWVMAMWDLDQHLRGIVKHGEGDHTGEQIEFADKLREEIRDILDGYGLNINN